MRKAALYILANKRNGTLYTGVTSNLAQRIHAHKNGLVEGFTKKYNCKLLVYFEIHETMPEAINREKKIKGSSRERKIHLIETSNPAWKDLYHNILDL